MAEGSILIVDDSRVRGEGIGAYVEMEGYEVAEAADGAAALAALEERDYDVALLDYRLPSTDGLSLLQTMKQRGCEAMVCMITAYANIDTAIAATRQGVNLSLPKPFSPDDLRASSRRSCATSRRARRPRACAPSTRRACSPSPRRRPRRTRSSAPCATPCSWSTGTATSSSPTPMLELLALGDDEVLMRPAQSCSAAAPWRRSASSWPRRPRTAPCASSSSTTSRRTWRASSPSATRPARRAAASARSATSARCGASRWRSRSSSARWCTSSRARWVHQGAARGGHRQEPRRRAGTPYLPMIGAPTTASTTSSS